MNPVFHISPRAKRLRITIKSSGECVVTVPKRMPMILVNRFVAEKAAWIAEKQEMMRKRGVGGGVWGVGDAVGAQHLAPPLVMEKYEIAKQESLRFTTQRVAAMNAHYGFTYKTITVRNQKTRWGSCSRRGNLNFNYRIMYLPPHLADYIVAHELCHLKEMNHSPRFWALVAQTFPQYRVHRRELRGYTVGER